MHLLVFRLHEQHYALPADLVLQIVPMVKLTAVPKAGVEMAGVMNFHGQAVPVISLARYFRLQEIPWQLYTPIVIVQHQGREIGLIVEEVVDVVSVRSTQIVDPAQLISTREIPSGQDGFSYGFLETSLLQGLLLLSDITIFVLDFEYLFQPEQVAVFLEAMAKLPDGCRLDQD